jgi:hypothetical protein
LPAIPSQVADRTNRFDSFIPLISVVSNSLDIIFLLSYFHKASTRQGT